MKYLLVLYRFLGVLIGQPTWVLKNLYNFTNDSVSKLHVKKRYRIVDGLPTVDLLDLVPALDEEVYPYSFLDGTSRPTDLALLRAMARRSPEGRYLEFGTWRGESLANVAPLIKEAVAVTFSAQDMRRQGFPESAIHASRCFSGALPNVRVIEHNTQTYDFTSLERSCDLVFVDADHEWQGVTTDTRNAFSLLRDQRSVIIWHDYGKDYETVNWQVLRGIMDGSPSDAHRKRIYHVSNSLCAIYINDPMSVSVPERYAPNKMFNLRLRAQRIVKDPLAG